jgi:hypothetical protein
MSTANRDSSYITLRRQQAALYAYNTDIQAAKISNANVRAEQPSYQSLAVITDRKQGGCVCSDTNAYTFVPTNINGAIQ